MQNGIADTVPCHYACWMDNFEFSIVLKGKPPEVFSTFSVNDQEYLN